MIMKSNGGTFIIALVPAYNESESIRATIESLLAQQRPLNQIIIIPNGCTDDTADIAREYPVTVMELPRLPHRKSEALNRAWLEFGQEADIVICMDSDTVFPATAIADWEAEMCEDRNLGGSSSKFTTQGTGFLGRLQKAEFSAWADLCLQRGETRVVSGTGAALSGEVMRQIASRPDREGPWSYTSQTEDFELTYRIRELGYKCHVSPKVRAYTDSMKDLKSLWNQRMKWQCGTIEDLISFGFNRLTWKDWMVQLAGLGNAILKFATIFILTGLTFYGLIEFVWYWMLLPALVISLEVKKALRIPHRDKWDILFALSFIPSEFFMWFRTGLFIRSWWDTLGSKITKKTKDRWEAQYIAEGV